MGLDAQRQRWERSRAEALAGLKSQLAVQRLKLGTTEVALTTAQEAAKKAQEAGGGSEESKRAEDLGVEVQGMQDAIVAMETQRLSLESEAFGRTAALRPVRAGPF